MAMLEIGQAVLVLTEKGVAYNGYIIARAAGDNGGPPAYQIAPHGSGQQSQWHKACEVFVPEEIKKEDPSSIESFLKKQTH
jgi:hypothetical protein